MDTPFRKTDFFEALKEDPEVAFERLFRAYFPYLCTTAYRYIPRSEIVEDLSQEVFYEVWRRRKNLTINTSLKAYLRRAVINKALNYLRDQKLDSHSEIPLEKRAPRQHIVGQLEAQDLQKLIDTAIDELPEKCRLVFLLSRFEELSYAEIAQRLDISPKTVENQIGKALRLLRTRLKPYLSITLLIFWMFF